MKKFIFFFLLFACFAAKSQDTTKKIFLPQIKGIVKTKFEYDLDNKLMRFAVRNARFGVKGNINELFSYYVQMDLNNEGRFIMLDAFVEIEPFTNFFVKLGQIKIPFSTDYIRNPAEAFFANRSFVAKYINQGLRDIGVVAAYKSKLIIPIEAYIGLFNGSGNNNPQWKAKPNYNARMVLGNDKNGLSVKGNFYGGDTENEYNLTIWGGEISYINKKFLIESEIIYRDWSDSLMHQESGFYLHSYYKIDFSLTKFKYILLTARYDFMGDDVFMFKTLGSRLTCGLNLGFDSKIFISEIRLNYENYFKKSMPIHTDKFTIEFLVRF